MSFKLRLCLKRNCIQIIMNTVWLNVNKNDHLICKTISKLEQMIMYSVVRSHAILILRVDYLDFKTLWKVHSILITNYVQFYDIKNFTTLYAWIVKLIKPSNIPDIYHRQLIKFLHVFIFAKKMLQLIHFTNT